MAALTSSKRTRWTQPSRSPTRPRDSPSAGVELRRMLARTPRRRELDERPQEPGHRQVPPERREGERSAHPARVRQDAEDDRANEPVGRLALVALLDQLPGLLDQPVVLHARRARGDAGHAAEAAVEVLDDGVRELERAFGQALHQPDPSARGVHLLLPERPVGRARRQAEAAVHAVVDQRRIDGHGLDHPSTPAGSNCARIRSTSAISAGSRGSATGCAT